MRTFLHGDERQKWDDKIDYCQVLRVVNKKILLNVYKSRPPVSQGRNSEFLEKRILVQDGDSYYVYNSSLPDNIHEQDPNYPRAQIVAGILRFTTLEDGRVQLSLINQRNFGFSGAMAAFMHRTAIGFMPNAFRNAYEVTKAHLLQMQESKQ